MSNDDEMSWQEFRETMRELRKERQRANHNSNIAIFDEARKRGILSGYDYIAHSSIANIRMPGKPKVDYYLTKSKWRAYLPDGNGKLAARYFFGDAERFLNWWRKQEIQD